jgi:outer membrane protein OmpA-like peptidoglycan-associated protein
MRIVSGILAAGLVAGLSTAALADGWYAGAETGLNLAPSEKYKDFANGTSEVKVSHDPGFGLLINGGYAFGQFRAEGEFGWRYNGVDKANGSDGKGNVQAYDLMANGYYDIKTGTAWTPYLGLGLGGADVQNNKIRNSSGNLTKDSDVVFAYQGIAGVSYALNDHLALNADYRYLRTLDGEYKPTDTYTQKVKAPYESHSLLVGFTYKFGAPAAPKVAPVAAAAPAPAPVPAPKPTQAVIAKSYLVFFDFDKSNITPEAQKIIEQAATNAKSSKATSIALTGHTDAAGSEKYNMALSLRRANAVKAALVKLGIPDNEISVVGKGKSDPLVPTADGVREPQNRRVQILLP